MVSSFYYPLVSQIKLWHVFIMYGGKLFLSFLKIIFSHLLSDHTAYTESNTVDKSLNPLLIGSIIWHCVFVKSIKLFNVNT